MMSGSEASVDGPAKEVLQGGLSAEWPQMDAAGAETSCVKDGRIRRADVQQDMKEGSGW